jgi:hypothetical protein
MRLVLGSLFDESTLEAARGAIQSDEKRLELRRDLEMRVLSDGRLGRIPEGDFGDNLIMALLALRTKFPRDEAFEKLEINIAMRDRRSGSGRN